MKRFQEKIKDIVETNPTQIPSDIWADPGETLSSYRFTDGTSVLMAKWLDAIADVQTNRGAGKAIAGMRGVGKSHFLATIAAIAGNPELRTRITDSHVAASAERLKRRNYVVAVVRRGTLSTLFEEIRDAIALALDVDLKVLGATLPEVLAFGATKAGDAPLVLIFDSLNEKMRRMLRDDGPVFRDLAERIATQNIFVGAALDEGSGGSDGVYAALAQSFMVDYLDQETLYSAIETQIFPKHSQKRRILRDLYEEFRKIFPHFQWSEQRFASLYPLHPSVLENAQFVRLYASDFGVIPFAAESGHKVAGRPAESLVTLVEVFDRVEPSLRKAEDLIEPFIAFDALNKDVVGSVPLMQRLRAKMILKGVFLLSLHGEGVTAEELCTSLLIYDESDPRQSVKEVDALLSKFADAAPNEIRINGAMPGEKKYFFRIGRSDDLNKFLAEKSVGAPAKAVELMLRRLSRERFMDWMLGDRDDDTSTVSSCEISWRGGMRRGQVVWNGVAIPISRIHNTDLLLDWEIFVGSRQTASENLSQTAIPTAHWITAELKSDEIELLRRYYVLLNDPSVNQTYPDQSRAMGHSLQTAAKKIWSRVFLNDAVLLLNGKELQIAGDDVNPSSLQIFLTAALRPLYEKRFPQHPIFGGDLTMSEVSRLVSEHFSGARPRTEAIQDLAASFAAPLGLVGLVGEDLLLESTEQISEQPLVKIVLGLLESDPSETISLDTIYKNLACEPYGLTREAQNLVLGALAAQGILEFVTTKGDRINHRSLDLKIIWPEIVGIARPHVRLKSTEELTQWARLLSLDESLSQIGDAESGARTEHALKVWNEEWREAKLLERFEALPDDLVNTRIWRIATQTQKSFGLISSTLDKFAGKNLTVEDCLQKVAEAFSNSEDEFAKRNADLATLVNFVSGATLRQGVWKYLAVSEITDDPEIEEIRRRIYALIEHGTRNPSKEINLELEDRWQKFRQLYVESFVTVHDSVMRSRELQETFETLLRSDEWWEFENLSAMEIFSDKHWRRAQVLKRKFFEMDCRGETRDVLRAQPTCVCSFRLLDIDEWQNLGEEFRKTIAEGRQSYRKTLAFLSESLAPVFENLANTEQDRELSEAARTMKKAIAEENSNPFNNSQLAILKKALKELRPPVLKVTPPSGTNSKTRNELHLQFRDWIDELPGQPVVFKY